MMIALSTALSVVHLDYDDHDHYDHDSLLGSSL